MMEIDINDNRYPPADSFQNDPLASVNAFCLEERSANRLPKFSLGQIVATPNALSELEQREIAIAIGRHMRGDWGELDSEDWKVNETALQHGDRLFSVYHSQRNVRFYVITEADRSVTTVLLPEDY